MSEAICIIGAGVVGLTAAVTMAKLGYDINLIDGKSICQLPARNDARVYALNQGSRQVLTRIDAWPGEQASPYLTMHVWDGGSPADIDFDCRDSGMSALGHIVAEFDLKKQLLAQATHDSRINLLENTRVHAIDDLTDAALIKLENGQSIRTPLVIIADGPNSLMRKRLHIPMFEWPYEQTAFIATIKSERAHQRCARQVFYPNSILAFLPLMNDHECAIVWSAQQDKAATLQALPTKQWDDTLTKAFESRLGRIELTSTPQSYPLILKHVRQYHGKHWLIMGDAAHTIHPMAGLGLNLGLADVECWYQLLKKSTCAIHSKRILGTYQRQRKASVWPVITFLQALKTLFNSDSHAFQFARRQGLSCLNNRSFIKRQIIARAMHI